MNISELDGLTRFEKYRRVLGLILEHEHEYKDYDVLTDQEVLDIRLSIYSRQMIRQILGYSLG